MLDWIQRQRFKRACRRWYVTSSPSSLINALIRVPSSVYTSYRPKYGLSIRHTFQYPTLEHYLNALRYSLDIVEQGSYVTSRKTRETPQSLFFDVYMTNEQGYSLPLSMIPSDGVTLYRQLNNAIDQHPEERARYYQRQFQHQTHELATLLSVIETLLTFQK